MKKLINQLPIIFIATFFVAIISCNSGGSSSKTSDTSQEVPGTIDTVPPVVNPGTGGDTAATIKTRPTNDNNAIMPDSTTIAQ